MKASDSGSRARLASSTTLRQVVRFLFRYRGLRILGHAVRRRLLVDRSVQITDFDGDLKFTCHLDEHIGSQMYWSDSYSSHQLRVLGRLLSSEMVFVDVGANQGEFTLFAAKRLTHGRVLAFEPMTEMFGRLQRNIEANGFSNVTAVPKGLWSESGSFPIFHGQDGYGDGCRNEGLGTLFRSASRPWVEDAELTTLDEYLDSTDLPRVDVIKIDVEGAESEVLRGAKRTIDRHRPFLFLEADRKCAAAAGKSLDELMSLVEDRYRLQRITRSGRVVAITRERLGDRQDLLCVPK